MILKKIKNIISIVRISIHASALRSTDQEKKKLAAIKITKYLSEHSGFLLKIGQFIGSSDQSHDEFKKLVQTNVKQSINFIEIKNILSKEYSSILNNPLNSTLNSHLSNPLKNSLDTLFSSIDSNGFSASISQVHKAITIENQELALKVKLPYIDEQMQSWLETLQLIPRLGPAKKWNLELSELKNEVSSFLKSELDFNLEKTKLNHLYTLCQVTSDFIAPASYDRLCTKNILAMTWIEAKAILPAAHKSEIEKKIIAELLIRFYLRSIFQWKFYQSDPNPGNFKIKGNQLVLLDAGSFSHFRPIDAVSLAILLSQTTLSPEQHICFLENLNFDSGKLIKIKQKIPNLIAILAEPFNSNHYNIKSWQAQKRIDDLLGDDKWWFRSAGPARLFPFMRSFGLFTKIISHFDIYLDWKALFIEEVLNPLQAEIQSQIQLQVQPKAYESIYSSTNEFPIDSVNADKAIGNLMIQKRFLHIHVINNLGETIVSIQFPIHEQTDLNELVPSDILERLNSNPLTEVQRLNLNIQSQQNLPFTLFESDTEQRKIKIQIVN